MTDQTLSHDLADYAARTRPAFDLLFSIEKGLPAQARRLTGWFAQGLSHSPEAVREAALAVALRDMVTVRNARLSFQAMPAQWGCRPVAVIAGDLGGAVLSGCAVVDLLRLVGRHEADMALRLIRDVQQTEARQRAQIAAALQRG